MLPNVISELQAFSLNRQPVIVKNTFVEFAEAEPSKLLHRRCKSTPYALWQAKAFDQDAEHGETSDEPLHEVRRRVFTVCGSGECLDPFGELERDSLESHSKGREVDESCHSAAKTGAQTSNFDATEVMSNASTQLPGSSIGSNISSNSGFRGRFHTDFVDSATIRVPLSLDSFVNEGLAFPAFAPTPPQDTTNQTTLMFRNLPQQFSRPKLERLLAEEGFGKLYDFIYLPADLGTGSCFGYAFINLLTPQDVERFVDHFQGFDRWPEGDTRRAVVHLSEALQGLAEQVERYRNSPLLHPSVSDELRPAVYTQGVRMPFPEPTVPIRPPRVRTSTKRKTPARKAAVSDF